MEHRQFERIASAVLALFSPLAEAEQRVSLALYRLLAEGDAVSTSALARVARVARTRVDAILSGQSDVYRESDGCIVGYGGLTISETSHRMRINGKLLHAWCAWDTLFIPRLLGTTAQIESNCPATGERISLTIHADQIDPCSDRPVVTFVAPDRDKATADIVRHFCCQVQFLATARAGGRWLSKRPRMRLATLEQAWLLGRRYIARRYPVIRA